jgi:hypothetical protein
VIPAILLVQALGFYAIDSGEVIVEDNTPVSHRPD